MTRPTNGIGLHLAILQFFFALTWTVYVIFLPRLAAEAGIAKQAIVFILLADQVIFTLTDWAMGVWADRAGRVVGRLGRSVALITGVSCLAFLLLPFVAPKAGPIAFLALTVVWTATSSALRAPPLVLIGKHAATPSQAWLASLYVFGLGVAGAVAPYLTVALRNEDPRWPFALSTIAVLVVAIGLVRAERALTATSAATAAAPLKSKPAFGLFLAGIACAGIGFQIHFSLNAAPAYLKFAKPADLEHLMPVFWIGFNLFVLPATFAVKRYGGMGVMAGGMLIGAAAAWATAHAGQLGSLLVAQFVAGAAWGCVLMSAVSAALAIGHTGAEGKATGAVFSMLALAAVARIGIVAAQLNQDPGFAPLLIALPVVAWLAAAVLIVLAARLRPMPYVDNS
jgi:hypothetical protein